MTSYTFSQLIDFTRTTSGTYTNSSGFITSTPASVNLLTYTQEFANAAWTKTALTVTANSTAAPDGTMTADTLVASAGTSARNCVQTAGGSGSALTLSLYAKAGTSNFVQLYHASNGTIFANFNLATGAVGTVGAGATAAITSVGNGWYRCAITFTPGSSGASRIGMITSATAVYAESWTAAGTETIFIWGAQLEQASSVTTYTRNYGGVYPPRFDYDPVTLAPRGLLIEEQRTNLLTYSQDWTNAFWNKTNGTITAAATTSPSGSVDAQKIEATASAATVITSGSVAVAATSATFSVYVKQGTGATTANTFALRNNTTATNLVSGTINYSTGAWTYTVGSTGVTVSDAGNGWWRIQIAATSGITSGNSIVCYVGFSGVVATAGDHLFAWGAQLEAGAFATSYIPTVASQVTRTADVAAINAPNFASWYNQSAGSFLIEWRQGGSEAVQIAASVNDGTANNIMSVLNDNSSAAGVTPGAAVTTGGAAQANLTGASITAGSINKSALAYALNDFAYSQNGAAALTDTSGTVPTVDRLDIGNRVSALFNNGHIRSIRFYPVRLTNAQLQALTA